MLSDQAIINHLKAVRYSSKLERNARRATSINGIARQAGLSRCHLHDIAAGRRPLGPLSRQRLADLFAG